MLVTKWVNSEKKARLKKPSAGRISRGSLAKEEGL